MNGSLPTPFSGTTNLSDEINKKLLNFAILTDEQNKERYEKRGAFDRMRRLEQNYRAKLAELIIHKRYVESNNYDKIFKIYEINKKDDYFQADVANEDNSYKCNVKSQDMESIQRYGIGNFTFQDTNIKRMFKNLNMYTHVAGVLIFNPLKTYIEKCNMKAEDIKLKKINWLILFHEPISIIYNSFNEKDKFNFTDKNVFTMPHEIKYQKPRNFGIGPWQKYILNYNKMCHIKFNKG